MSYLNKDFLSYSFLKKLEKESITKEKKDKIEENLLYFFDILEDIPKEMSEEKYQKIIYKDTIDGILFDNTKYTNGIIEIYNNINEKLIVLEFKKKITSLDRRFENYQDLKVINYGKENKFKFAVLTDGTIWRIYKLNTANYFENFIEINIESFIKTREIDFSISLLENFINQENLIINKETQKSDLDIFLENSDLEINKIEKELKSKMEDILSGIGLGFKEAIGKENFTSEESKELYNDSITVLYRTLFIIYAEAKNLLPIEEEEYKLLSFNKMIEDVEFEVENNNTSLWEKMERLFSYIDKGYIGRDITIEAYNGGLFNNKNRQYLGKYSISNKNWIKVLKKIAFYEKGSKLIERIEFKDLSTRSFGTLYEGILDYNMFIASEDLLKRKEGSKIIYTPLSRTSAKKTDIIIKKGEIYLSEDAFERKDTGAYYTPEPIVEYITSNTVDLKIDEILNKNEKFLLEIKELKEKINIEYDPFLKETLQEELYSKIIFYIEKNILTIPVLDNAMGSGHFLVNATYHIASKIYSFIHKYIDFEVLVEEEKIYEFSYWLRKVVTHNIYGIDINNLAVQLGKLSLWLISASKDKPLSFLDHHLKCGNSLLGTTRKEIDETLGDNIDITKSNNRTLFDITIDNLMSNIDLKLKKFKEMTENTAQEIHDKEKFYYEEIQNELENIKIKWNIYLSMQMENKNGIVKKEEYDKIVNLKIDKIQNEFSKFNFWQEIAKKNQVFHWELEFPDVFINNKKGFEIIIGNPPYLKERGNKKTFENIFLSSFGRKYRNGKMDYWYYFLHKAITLLDGENSFISYITPRYWIESTGSSILINHIKEELNVKSIVDIGKLKVFDSVVGLHMIAIYKKSMDKDFITEYKQISNTLKDINEEENTENLQIKYINSKNLFTSQNTISFNSNEKLNLKSNKLLGECYNVSQGVVQNPDKINDKLAKKFNFVKGAGVFVLNEEELMKLDLTSQEFKFVKKFYEENQIENYILNDSRNKYLIYLTKENCEDISEYKNLEKHLEKYRIIMEERRETKNKSNKFFHLHWPRKKEIFENPKIILPQMFSTVKACYVEKEGYFGMASNIIYNNDESYSLKYLLGILNSKLGNYWFNENGKKRGIGVDIGVSKLKEFPLVFNEDSLEIEKLVDKILILKKENKDTVYLEKEIDNLIYKIYGLNDKEKDIIENYNV